MAWLLLVTREEHPGEYKMFGGPHATQEAAEKEGAQLRAKDAAIIDYKVVEADNSQAGGDRYKRRDGSGAA